jgi:hypothetical protein
MLTRRWQLVSAFAGGCLSSGVIAIVWAAKDDGEGTAHLSRSTARPIYVMLPADDTPLEAAPAAVPERTAMPVAAPAEPEETGRSLAEVLASLEAEYRKAAPTTPVAPARPGESEPVAAPQVLASNAPVATVAALPSATVTSVATSAALPAAAPPTVTRPVAALPPTEDARARPEAPDPDQDQDRRLRDAYIASIYEAELYRQQQLALLQYLALISQSRESGRLAPPPSRPLPRPSPTFSFPLTNPNNPWGFQFPPTVLAK